MAAHSEQAPHPAGHVASAAMGSAKNSAGLLVAQSSAG